MIAPQAVAISTRSSLASLPAMLAAARDARHPRRGRRRDAADRGRAVPRDRPGDEHGGRFLCRALARATSRASPQMIAATAVGAVMSYGAVSLPGEVSFISSIAPIALALGRADRAAGAAGRGRDDPGHLPHRRQCLARRGRDDDRRSIDADPVRKPERPLTVRRFAELQTICTMPTMAVSVEQRATMFAPRRVDQRDAGHSPCTPAAPRRNRRRDMSRRSVVRVGRRLDARHSDRQSRRRPAPVLAATA